MKTILCLTLFANLFLIRLAWRRWKVRKNLPIESEIEIEIV